MGGAANGSSLLADADGFVPVVRRGARKPRPQPPAPTAAAMRTNTWGDVDGDEDMGSDVGGEAEEDAEEGGAEGDEPPEDSAATKARWDKEAATVRLLERNGMHSSHPVLRAAVAARDAAAQAHRRGKTPHPVARRMGWAQSKLDRALRMQDRTRAELAAFDEECRLRRLKLTEKLDEDRARVGKHRRALEDLQVEAGAEMFSPNGAAAGGKEACDRAAASLRSAAPRVVALAQSLPEDSPARREVNLLLAELSTLQSQLDQAAWDKGGAENFDIADGESEWSESHELGTTDAGGPADAGRGSSAVAPPGWRAEGHGRWQNGKGRSGAADPPEGKGSASSGADCGQPAPPQAPTQAAPAVVPPRVIRGEGRTADGDGECGDERAAKHRRGQEEADSARAAAAVQDANNAMELLQQHAAGAAAGFGTPNGVRLAAQQHARQVEKVVMLATDHGIQAVTEDGQDLIVLGPDDLRAWAKKHLSGKTEAWW